MKNLQLTYDEVSQIISGRIDRFKILFDDIPHEGSPNDYIEDDGRQLRSFEFKDLETGQVYEFGYVWHSDYPEQFPHSFLGPVDNIDFVQTSVLFPPKPLEKPTVVLSEVEKAAKILWKQYEETEVKHIDKVKKNIPTSDMDEVVDFFKNSTYNFLELRKTLITFCIKYEIEQISLLRYLQKRK